MKNDKVVKLVDYNEMSSSRVVQDALEDAIEIVKEEGQKVVLILLLDNEDDNYGITEVSAGIDRNTDAVALLDITKTKIKNRMGF